MYAKLVSNGSLWQGEEFALEQFPYVFGRAAGVSLQLDDRWVSRHHCQIDMVDGELVVQDLNSTHGTLVNNLPVGETTLQPGDRLTIGLTSFKVCSLNDDSTENAHALQLQEADSLNTAS